MKSKRTKKRYRKLLFIFFAIIVIITVSCLCFVSLKYMREPAKQVIAYFGQTVKFFTHTVAMHREHKKPASPAQNQPEVKVEFEFYSALTNMRVKVPNTVQPRNNRQPKKQLIEAEELENDVLKHIK